MEDLSLDELLGALQSAQEEKPKAQDAPPPPQCACTQYTMHSGRRRSISP